MEELINIIWDIGTEDTTEDTITKLESLIINSEYLTINETELRNLTDVLHSEFRHRNNDNNRARINSIINAIMDISESEYTLPKDLIEENVDEAEVTTERRVRRR